MNRPRANGQRKEGRGKLPTEDMVPAGKKNHANLIFEANSTKDLFLVQSTPRYG